MRIYKPVIFATLLSLLVVFGAPSIQKAPVASAQTQAQVEASLLKKIQELLQVVDYLREVLRLQNQGVVTTATPTVSRFTTPLRLGDTHPEVYQLQVFLNKDPDTRIATSGAGSPGLETSYFGSLTEAAVKKFQRKHLSSALSFLGIFGPSGVWDQATLEKANSLLNPKASQVERIVVDTQTETKAPPRGGGGRGGGGSSSGGGGSTPPANQAPTIQSVSASASAITLPTNTVTLSVTATDDGRPSGSTLSYSWVRTSGPSSGVSISNNTSANATATFTEAGTYGFQVTVSDGALSTTSSNVTVVVSAEAPGNQAPVVNAGSDQSIVLPNNSVNLSGGATDDGLPAGSSLSYTWTRQSGPDSVTFSSPNSQDTTATFSEHGNYVLRLTVSDGELSSFDDINVTVHEGATEPPTNEAPTITDVTASPSAITLPTNTVTLSVTATDDGLPTPPASLSYNWELYSGPSGGVTLSNYTSSTATATFSEHGVYVFEVTVSDGDESVTDTVTVTVSPEPPQNQPPVITSISATPSAITLPTSSSTLSVTATDDGLPTGSSLSYSWVRTAGPSGGVNISNNTSANATATFSQAGSYTFRATVSDGALSTNQTVSVTVNPQQSGGGGEVEYENRTYNADNTTDFLNPERGWYVEDAGGLGANKQNALPVRNHIQNVTLQMHYVNLSDYRNTDTLPTNFLNSLESTMQSWRTTGKKAVLRFAYNRDETGLDAPWSRMSGHIDQLSPLLHEYKDVIGVFQAGFVGAWGEMHTSSNGIAPSNANGRAFVNKILEATPDDMIVQFRTPYWMTTTLPDVEPLSYGERFTETKHARIGHYNDCIAAGQWWVTWWGDTPELTPQQEMDYSFEQGRLTSAGGETCSAGGGISQWNDAPLVISQFEAGGWDYLNSEYWTDMYGKWNSSGHLGEISRRLGYRLRLTNASLPVEATSGAEVTIQFTMTNDGFGKVYNPRPIDLVLRPSSGGDISVRLTPDARRDLPLGGETKTLSYTVNLPTLSNGNYDLYLALPDPSPNLESDPRYSIRLANTGTWVSASGLNNLNTVMVVGEGGSEPEPPQNQPPVITSISATPSEITLPTNSVSLSVTATDDGLPTGSSLSYSWVRTAGPSGGVTLSNYTSSTATATFSEHGVYVFEVTVSDGDESVTDTVTVTVSPEPPQNQPPVITSISATPSAITLPTSSSTLSVTATDDGLPAGSSLSYTWTRQSGPSSAVIANASSASTTVTFSQAGTYQFRATVSDGVLSTNRTVSVVVSPESEPPGPQSHPLGPQTVVSTPVGQGTHFVSASGSGSSCTQANPCSIQTAISQSGPGDVVFLRGGTYNLSGPLHLNTSGTAGNPVTFESYPGERAVFDGQYNDNTRVIMWQQNNYLVLRNISVTRMTQSGGVYVQGNNNLFDGVHSYNNRASGFAIYSDYDLFPYGAKGSHNVIRNCVVYGNSDVDTPAEGDNADGISVSSGEGNKVLNCLIYGNSDDGIDAWRATNTEFAYNIIHSNGLGPKGNGNGIKAGGPSPSNYTLVHHNISYGNRSTGIDQNSGANVSFFNNVSWDNNRGYVIGSDTIVRNNISFENNISHSGTGINSHNTWNSGFSVSANDFESLDPNSPLFFVLKPGSSLINAGTNVGLPYNGSAPDLGAIETNY